MDIITEHATERNTQLRPNLWQTPEGAVVGYGAMLAPGGFYHCFTCNGEGCEHCQAVDEAWLSGRDTILIETNGKFWGILVIAR